MGIPEFGHSMYGLFMVIPYFYLLEKTRKSKHFLKTFFRKNKHSSAIIIRSSVLGI